MTLLYWLSALVIVSIMTTLTAYGVTFFLDLTLSSSLPYEHRKVWRGFQNGLIFLTYFVVTIFRKPFQPAEIAAKNWQWLWFNIEGLLKYHFKCFLLIVLFYLGVTFVVKLYSVRS